MKSPADRKKQMVKAVHCSALYNQVYRHEKDAYQDLLREHYGVESSKDLEIPQLANLLDYLNQRIPSPNHIGSTRKRAVARKRGSHGGVVSMVTAGERKKISVLKGLVAWEEADGFNRWLWRRFRIESIRTAEDALKAIEGLKGLFESQMRARYGKQWHTLTFEDRGIRGYIERHIR